MGQYHNKGPSLRRETLVTRHASKGDMTRRRMACEQQINRLPGQFAVTMN